MVQRTILKGRIAPCRSCGCKDTIDLPRDPAGYNKVICKDCKAVLLKYGDNGSSIDVSNPKRD